MADVSPSKDAIERIADNYQEYGYRFMPLVRSAAQSTPNSELGALAMARTRSNCLVDDDKLITEVRIVTDRLLIPIDSGERVNDVELVTHVHTSIFASLSSVIADHELMGGLK